MSRLVRKLKARLPDFASWCAPMAASARLGSWMRWSSWTRSLGAVPLRRRAAAKQPPARAVLPMDAGGRGPGRCHGAVDSSVRHLPVRDTSWSHKRRVVVEGRAPRGQGPTRASCDLRDRPWHPRAIYETLYCPARTGPRTRSKTQGERSRAIGCPAPRTLPTRSELVLHALAYLLLRRASARRRPGWRPPSADGSSTRSACSAQGRRSRRTSVRRRHRCNCPAGLSPWRRSSSSVAARIGAKSAPLRCCDPQRNVRRSRMRETQGPAGPRPAVVCVKTGPSHSD